jgi:hypothetical protein
MLTNKKKEKHFAELRDKILSIPIGKYFTLNDIVNYAGWDGVTHGDFVEDIMLLLICSGKIERVVFAPGKWRMHVYRRSDNDVCPFMDVNFEKGQFECKWEHWETKSIIPQEKTA